MFAKYRIIKCRYLKADIHNLNKISTSYQQRHDKLRVVVDTVTVLLLHQIDDLIDQNFKSIEVFISYLPRGKAIPYYKFKNDEISKNC